MSAQIKNEGTEKKYYILDLSLSITPVEDYKFKRTETHLESLVESECFASSKISVTDPKLENLIKEMGFGWEPLSELGQMRQMPYATTIMEAIGKYSWAVAEQFCTEQDYPVYRISGGELFDSGLPEFQKQLDLVSEKPGLYGSSHYYVTINGGKMILRYSSCTQKLSIAQGLKLQEENLPIGLFEISKSYRFEEEKELQLCNRTRSFYLPELHILTESFSSSLKVGIATHHKILYEIKKISADQELLCSVTYDFLEKNKQFLKEIVRSIEKPILLVVYDKNDTCEDGVKIDIEYKIFDQLGTPIEISTFQIDDGSTDSTFNINYQSRENVKNQISTVHIVFNASLERFAYLLLDRSIQKEEESGIRTIPFWLAPVQVRVIAYSNKFLKTSKELAKELNSLNIRTDIDDREISYVLKKQEKDLVWVPYIVTVKSDEWRQNLEVINRTKGIQKTMSLADLLGKMANEPGKNIIVPRYFPMSLAKRLLTE